MTNPQYPQQNPSSGDQPGRVEAGQEGVPLEQTSATPQSFSNQNFARQTGNNSNDAQLNPSQEGYPPPGDAGPGYPQSAGTPNPGYPQVGAPNPGYPQMGVQNPSYPQVGSSSLPYQQPSNTNPGYRQMGAPNQQYPNNLYGQPYGQYQQQAQTPYPQPGFGSYGMLPGSKPKKKSKGLKVSLISGLIVILIGAIGFALFYFLVLNGGPTLSADEVKEKLTNIEIDDVGKISDVRVIDITKKPVHEGIINTSCASQFEALPEATDVVYGTANATDVEAVLYAYRYDSKSEAEKVYQDLVSMVEDGCMNTDSVTHEIQGDGRHLSAEYSYMLIKSTDSDGQDGLQFVHHGNVFYLIGVVGNATTSVSENAKSIVDAMG